MDFLWDWIRRLFSELPDPWKAAVLVLLISAAIGTGALALNRRLQVKRLTKDLGRLREKLEKTEEDRDQLLARFQALDKIDSHVWTKADSFANNTFVDPRNRRTRFLAVCNLKGGVGKTTLTLNLGIALARRGKRVLLVDLDFQGTLSNMALNKDHLQDYRDKGWTTDRLLREIFPGPRIREFSFSCKDEPGCRIMLAREHLEVAEFEQQSRFFVDPEREVRFHIQKNLQVPEILQEFDYVLFDCPPRMSTACINALTCADWVLIPSTLSQLDIEAVPRTLKWLLDLRTVVRGCFLGVVVTRARMRADKLVSYEFNQLNTLKEAIRGSQPGEGFVFEAMIQDHPKIHQFTAERKAVAAHWADGKIWFEAVAQEVERKVHR